MLLLVGYLYIPITCCKDKFLIIDLLLDVLTGLK